MRLKTTLNHGLNFKCFCIGKSEGLEKEEREKERTFSQKVFPSRIWLLHKRLRAKVTEARLWKR